MANFFGAIELTTLTPGDDCPRCEIRLAIAKQNNPNANTLGHYPSAKDPGQSKSWIPVEAWEFISQF